MAALAEPRHRRREQTTLALEGMTCASCAARSSVSEQARQRRGDGQLRDRDGCCCLRPAARRTRRARRRGREEPATTRNEARRTTEHAHEAPPTRLIACPSCLQPLVLMAMIPPLQFTGWEWVSLALATPVVLLVAARSSIAPRCRTLGTAQRRWTRWSRSARSLPGPGRRSLCSADSTPRLLRGGGRDHRADPARPLLRGAGEAALGCGDPRAARAGRQGSARAARRRRRCSSRSSELRSATLFVVRPGEKIATDGVVVEGASAVDQSMLTGEPVPVEVGRATTVAGATINRQRPSRRARDAGRRRHGARADRPAGRAGAGREGRRCSGWPTGSRRSSCRSCSASRSPRSPAGCCRRAAHRPPSPPPSRC